MSNFGWKGSFAESMEADNDYLINSLCLHIYNQPLEEARINHSEESTLSQIKSWYDCINYLIVEVLYFQHLTGFLIFEYEKFRSERRS